MEDFEIFLKWLTGNRLADAFFMEVAEQNKTKEFFEFCLNKKRKCNDFISSAFILDETIQGYEFWLAVCRNWLDFFDCE